MIKTCVLLYALVINNFSIGIDPTTTEIGNLFDCKKELPRNCLAYSTLLVENFDQENLETAFIIMWCESRGNTQAYRYDNQDSGLFQFIPRTYGWVTDNSEIPRWDYPIGNTYSQFVPKYNIQAAAILIQDLHSYNPYWKPFSSSQKCWENTKTFLKLVELEK